jgi:hypothetical protein
VVKTSPYVFVFNHQPASLPYASFSVSKWQVPRTGIRGACVQVSARGRHGRVTEACLHQMDWCATVEGVRGVGECVVLHASGCGVSETARQIGFRDGRGLCEGDFARTSPRHGLASRRPYRHTPLASLSQERLSRCRGNDLKLWPKYRCLRRLRSLRLPRDERTKGGNRSSWRPCRTP